MESSLWGWKLFSGILGILAGIVVLQHPIWSAILVSAILVIFLAAQAIVSGGAYLVMAFQGGGWGIGTLGALNIILGLVLLFQPPDRGCVPTVHPRRFCSCWRYCRHRVAFNLRGDSSAQEAGEARTT
jgi:uncharacterized membrane protein HdeD (DUF308 family)